MSLLQSPFSALNSSRFFTRNMESVGGEHWNSARKEERERKRVRFLLHNTRITSASLSRHNFIYPDFRATFMGEGGCWYAATCAPRFVPLLKPTLLSPSSVCKRSFGVYTGRTCPVSLSSFTADVRLRNFAMPPLRIEALSGFP